MTGLAFLDPSPPRARLRFERDRVELGSNWHTINVVLGNLPAHMATAVSD